MKYKYQNTGGKAEVVEVLTTKTLSNFENAIPVRYPLSREVPEWNNRTDLEEGKDFEFSKHWASEYQNKFAIPIVTPTDTPKSAEEQAKEYFDEIMYMYTDSDDNVIIPRKLLIENLAAFAKSFKQDDKISKAIEFCDEKLNTGAVHQSYLDGIKEMKQFLLSLI